MCIYEGQTHTGDSKNLSLEKKNKCNGKRGDKNYLKINNLKQKVNTTKPAEFA